MEKIDSISRKKNIVAGYLNGLSPKPRLDQISMAIAAIVPPYLIFNLLLSNIQSTAITVNIMNPIFLFKV
jgi:hypothetical protein